MNKLILASASPRRREIFELLGLSFDVCPAKAEPGLDPARGVHAAVQAIARAKAEEVFQSNPGRTVVGADTVVALGDTVLGKPQDAERAKAMLRALSGRAHRVLTGVYVCAPRTCFGFTAETTVHFYPLTETEIGLYVQSGEPMDKAGAYGIQGRGLRFVAGIEGDYYNVVGFPAAAFVRKMEERGLL